MFVIRSQGFFYTDEYFAPSGAFKQLSKRVFDTRAEAQAACDAYARQWIRGERLGDFLFEDQAAIDDVLGYLHEHFPDEMEGVDRYGLIDAAIPKQASDAQVDEVLRRGKLEMAQVFEVSEPPPEELDEGGEDDFEDELYYGPSPAA